MATPNRKIDETTASLESAIDAGVHGGMVGLHTALPAIIDAYDPARQTVSAQPAINRSLTDGTIQTLPLCTDVPVVFLRGGGFAMTFPIAAGDECLLVFSERSIDEWYQDGGIQTPGTARMHSLSDGFAIVGVGSQPKKILSVDPANVEIRDASRQTRVSITPAGNIESRTASGAVDLLATGAVVVNAPTGVTITGPVTITGALIATSVTTTAGKDLASHVHGGVQSGFSQTGPPI